MVKPEPASWEGMGPLSIADRERALSLAYAPRNKRQALAALWALDETLGAAVARTSGGVIGQMRLTWWHDALRDLHLSRPVDPVLTALATSGLDPASLLPLIDGWEAVLDPLPLPESALESHAADRGATLFRAAGRLLGAADERVAAAGRLWALVDLAFRISDRDTAQRSLALAPHPDGPLPPPLAVLTSLAKRDRQRGLDRPRHPGSPVRVARAVLAGLTGR